MKVLILSSPEKMKTASILIDNGAELFGLKRVLSIMDKGPI